MRFSSLVILIVFLVACGGEPPAAVAPLPPPPTAIPLGQVDLESLLIQSGDLPKGVAAGAVTTALPKIFADITTADRAAYQPFKQEGGMGSGVTVLLYSSTKDIERAYAFILDGFGSDTKPIGNVGDRATLATVAGALSATEMQAKERPVLADLAFMRCHAVVHIRMRSATAEEDVKAYAKRLDARLSAVVC